MKVTKRELDVMNLLVSGLTNKQIGQRLGISNHTVRDHISTICGKLNAANRVELAAIVAKIEAQMADSPS
ncbi:response regulator transcription factor [Pseudomonas sp. nanlin1]|uniref:response regulator transcription factor n=1 Tax=Pseudomonas sp. nanlin1 TaxID=3040605 RepID=UPI00388FFE93